MKCRCGAHPLFNLGQIEFSPHADEVLQQNGMQLIEVLWPHVTGQWHPLDAARNESAVRNGRVVVSVFSLAEGWEVTVGTVADRTATLVDVRRQG